VAIVEAAETEPRADPGNDHGRVESLGIVTQEIAPGDVIGPHLHDLDEAITILEGSARVRLGDDEQVVRAGAVAFVPAGVPHSTSNPGPGTLRIHAVFAGTSVEIRSADDAGSTARLDLRTGDYRRVD
jgi:quercetin dioxygenase-like cupin family protein